MPTDSKAQPTAGPWEVISDRDERCVWSPSCEAQICTVDGNGQPDSELSANAHLIAAAPEMAEVLRKCVAEFADQLDYAHIEKSPLLRKQEIKSITKVKAEVETALQKAGLL